MNSLYEPVQLAARLASRPAPGVAAGVDSVAACYLPLEYREVGETFPLPSEEERPERSPESDRSPAADSQPEDPLPDPAEVLAALIEQERHAITAQAHQDAEREIQRARAAIAGAIEQFAQQRDEYFRQAEAEIVGLALAIARRLIHRESQIDPRLLAGLVRHELEQLEGATSVRLLVSPETLSYWNEAVRTIPCPVEVASDKTLDPGDARIETALGSTTVSFERELKEIERGFFDLLSRRPAASEGKAVRVQ
jgi:flagellar assembly protein FliH